MSTKIYNGYRCRGVTAKQVFDWLRSLKPKYEAAHLGLILTYKTFLKNDIYDEEVPEKRRLNLKAELEAEIKCEVVVIPTDEPETFLLVAFNQMDDIFEHFPPWLEFFGYWNSTDPEEGVPEEEWEERGRVWDQYIGYGPLANYGYICQIYDRMDAMLVKEDNMQERE